MKLVFFLAMSRNNSFSVFHIIFPFCALSCAKAFETALFLSCNIRLIKIFKRYKKHELVSKYEVKIKKNIASGHYCIAFGIYAFFLGIPLEETLYSYYYNTAIGLVTNSVKLVPLGQLDGQDIMFRLQPVMEKLTSETLIIDRSLVGMLDTGLDIRCMQHEHLYSRLYMS